MNPWAEIDARLTEANAHPLVVRIFRQYVEQVLSGQKGFIEESTIDPINEIPDLDRLPGTLEEIGREALAQTAILKLNGGLGTSMGLTGPKSLLPVRDGRTFLDFIVAQASALGVPLVLMNSFATDSATKCHLQAESAESSVQIHTFLQHCIPKLWAHDLTPVTWEEQPELAWCPPGHGDLYAALITSGTLERLRDDGRRYLFVSNADNLGATFHPLILGFMIRGGHGFLMEVTDRTATDRKGGHLAQRTDGTLLLRESAQCNDRDRDAFQDIERHRFFNTNNLWIDLEALAETLRQHDNALPLTLIVNRKPVDPTNPTTPEVLQLETAMGSAISLLPRAAAIRVPRTRFSPVKTTSDLLAVRSDAYRLNDDHTVTLARELNAQPPVVQLDDRFFRQVKDMERRIRVLPSLRDCTRLNITGEFNIQEPTVFIGDVELVNEGSKPVSLGSGTFKGCLRFEAN